MFLVGIVTNQKNELYVKKELSDIICKENIIFINDKNNKGITKIFLTDIECNFINVAKKLMQIEDISIKKLNN